MIGGVVKSLVPARHRTGAQSNFRASELKFRAEINSRALEPAERRLEAMR